MVIFIFKIIVVKIFINDRGDEKMMQIFSVLRQAHGLKKRSGSANRSCCDCGIARSGVVVGDWWGSVESNTLTAYPFLNVDWLQAIFTS